MYTPRYSAEIKCMNKPNEWTGRRRVGRTGWKEFEVKLVWTDELNGLTDGPRGRGYSLSWPIQGSSAGKRKLFQDRGL